MLVSCMPCDLDFSIRGHDDPEAKIGMSFDLKNVFVGHIIPQVKPFLPLGVFSQFRPRQSSGKYDGVKLRPSGSDCSIAARG